jgi:sphinganine-1-phosphate aldolase
MKGIPNCLVATFTHRYNRALRGVDPITLIAIVQIANFIVNYIKGSISQHETTQMRMARWALKIPQVEKAFKKKMVEDFEKNVVKVRSQYEKFGEPFLTLPKKGMSGEAIIEWIDRLDAVVRKKIDGQHFSGTVYRAGVLKDQKNVPKQFFAQGIEELFAYATLKAGYWNSLHPDIFNVGFYLEWQLVQIVSKFNGGDPTKIIGMCTSGGTESLMTAARAFKKYKMAQGYNVNVANIFLAPPSIHAGINKGIDDYGLDFQKMPVDINGRIDLKALEKFLKEYASSIVGMAVSAPCYETGSCDPVKEVAVLAEKYGVLLHVDCCLGGFLYKEECLKFPGVTSLSIDTHKNGGSIKGSSVIQFTKWLVAIHAMYAYPGWSAVYGSPGAPGSRSVLGPLCALISLLYQGQEGMDRMRERVLEATTRIRNIVNDQPDLEIIGNPTVNVVAFRFKPTFPKGAIYALAECMKARRFHLNQLKIGLHICVTEKMAAEPKMVEDFETALKESIATVKMYPQQGRVFDGDAKMYGSVEAALSPTLANNPSRFEYVQNCIMGVRGTNQSVYNFFLAYLNPNLKY